MTTLSERLKKYRDECGFTQQEVANVLNVDRSTYSYYELGRSNPDLPTLKKLMLIFNVSYQQLLDDDPGMMQKVSDVKKEDLLHKLTNINKSDVNDKTTKTYYSYELSNTERQLIAFYRVLNKKQKSSLLNKIDKLIVDNKKQKNK